MNLQQRELFWIYTRFPFNFSIPCVVPKTKAVANITKNDYLHLRKVK